MRAVNLQVAVVVAGLALAVPAMAQDPRGGGGAPGGGASERTGGGGAAANSGGGGGGNVAASGGGGGGSSMSSGESSFSSPSAGAASSPSISVSDRGFVLPAPQHRYSESSSTDQHARTASGGGHQSSGGGQASPRGGSSSGGSGGGSGGSSTRGGSSAGGSGGGSGATSNRGGGGGDRAVPRGGSASAEGGRVRDGGNQGRERVPNATAEHNAAENSNVAREVPEWSRPRGDRPVSGTAVTRTTPLPDRNGRAGSRYYDPYYGYDFYGVGYYGGYYPYYYSPFGYGLGYGMYSGFYPNYDPWYDPYDYGAGYSSYSRNLYYSREQGALKLKVKPKSAKVYVDGYFVGAVDDFDGAFQKLPLNGGQHKVEIRADGYATAEFDVLITPGQTVTFAGELKRIQ